MSAFESLLDSLSRFPPRQLIPETLSLLCERTNADAALLFRTLDAQTAHLLSVIPAQFPADGSLSIPWTASLPTDLAIDIVPAGLPSSAWDAKSSVIIPVRAAPSFEGFVFLFWRRAYSISLEDRELFRAAALYLRALAPLAGAEADLRASEKRYKQLFDNLPLPAWVYDASTLAFLTVNEAAILQYGYTREEFLVMTIADIRPPEDVSKLIANVRGLGVAQQESGPWRHRKKDGTLIIVAITSHPVEVAGHNARLIVAKNITERSVADQQLREQEERWQLALRGSNDGLWDYNVTNGQVFYSNRWKEMLGYKEDELSNTPEQWEARVHPDDLPGVQVKLADHLSRRTSFYNSEYRLRCKDGSYKWILARGQAVWDESGAPVRMVGSHTDITERKQAEERLTREALYDSLTGLLNRRYLMEELNRAILMAETMNFPLAVAICDIDFFKDVNDTHGHIAGDEVLATIGQILLVGRRQGELAGRIGGDEFCLVFPRATLSEAGNAVERIRNQLRMREFRGSQGAAFTVTASFGLAAAEPAIGSKTLLEMADRALYAAKKRAPPRVEMRPTNPESPSRV